ncbi:small integral membrane protein 28-like [Hemibagrus wyckioides]|nr:small integral membrane protein 28-like [Hemibagrus wyckioides]XP_058236425.1 small integral membrane protein 28-like [Hemibagrus wyckioides]XP_058236426.1 small integral membrane protein 28-like [Hemibagrus wyckioides]
MRKLPESSWMKFGPAGRGSYDWMAGASSPPPEEKQLQGYHWNELLTEQDAKTEIILYIILPLVLLFIFCLTAFLIYQRCSRGKLSLANIIALDLQDTDSSAEILASLTANAERLNSTSSDTSDGVFLMVYLPPPYEETLTKITRAASLTSGKDVECIKMEDLEAKLCPELKSRGHYV